MVSLRIFKGVLHVGYIDSTDANLLKSRNLGKRNQMTNEFVHSKIFWARENLFDLFQLVYDLGFIQYGSTDYHLNILNVVVSIVCIKEFRYVTLHILKCLLTISNDFVRIDLSVFINFRIFLFDFLKVLIKDFGILKGEYFGSNLLKIFQGGWESSQVSNLSLSVVFGIIFKILYQWSLLAELSEIIEERFDLSNPLNDLLRLSNLNLDDILYIFAVLQRVILFSFHIKHSLDILDESIPLNEIEVLYLKQLFDWELLVPQILSDFVN